MRKSLRAFRTLATVVTAVTLLYLCAETSPAQTASPLTPVNSGSPTPMPGITTGTLPIESTILAYQALSAEALQIAGGLRKRVVGHRVVIGTARDIDAIIQLRILIAQTAGLQLRISGLDRRLSTFTCGRPTPTPTPKHAVTIAGIAPQSVSDLVSLINAAAPITAVNQTISPASVSLADASLVNLVAASLETSATYVPSVFPPGLIAGYVDPKSTPMYHFDLRQTFIGQALANLDAARQRLLENADKALYEKCNSNAASKVLASEVATTAVSVTDFENALFAGQNVASKNDLVTLFGNRSFNSLNREGSNGQGKDLTRQPESGAGAMLQQVLSADLLLQQLPKDMTSGTPGDQVLFLAVHMLESGGSDLTKSNLFSGSRIYFSGGAVATFALFRSDGGAICGGVSYGYRGFVAADGMSNAVSNTSARPGVIAFATTCDRQS